MSPRAHWQRRTIELAADFGSSYDVMCTVRVEAYVLVVHAWLSEVQQRSPMDRTDALRTVFYCTYRLCIFIYIP